MSSTALQQEFDVQYEVERDHLEIRILPSSSFPKGALEQSAVVQLLVWLFSDQDVMDSYESILGTINKIEKLRTALKAGALALTLRPCRVGNYM